MENKRADTSEHVADPEQCLNKENVLAKQATTPLTPVPSNELHVKHNDRDQPGNSEVQSDKTTLAFAPFPSWRKIWSKLPSQDQSDPALYSETKKHIILGIVATAGAISPIASTVYYPALASVQRSFNTSDTAVNASVAMFVFLTAFFPLIWATSGDAYGRRPVYIISFGIAIVGTICCALSVNIAMLIVFRGFSAIGSSSVMSMGAGTLTDIFEARERGRAYAWYVLGPILGPAVGPVIGGYLTEAFGWKSTFWFLAAFSGIVWLLILLCLPETNRVSTPKDLPLAVESEKSKKKRNMTNPISAIKLLWFPNVFLAVVLLGILFMTYYLLNTTFTWTYTNQYGLDPGLVGVCYIPTAIGGIVGSSIGGRLSDYVYNKNVAANEGEGFPEMRLSKLVLIPAMMVLFGSLVLYGWCTDKNLHYSLGLVWNFFAAGGIMLPHVTLTTYLVDSFKSRSASVTACNNLSRYILAGISTLFASDLQRALGNGILFTVFGGLCVITAVPLLYVKVKGQKWKDMREKYAHLLL